VWQINSCPCTQHRNFTNNAKPRSLLRYGVSITVHGITLRKGFKLAGNLIDDALFEYGSFVFLIRGKVKTQILSITV